jgi:hypothetical protein
LEELHEVTKRIEKLSQAEHDLMSDLHPEVGEIKEHVQNVEEAVSPERADLPSTASTLKVPRTEISTPLGK